MDFLKELKIFVSSKCFVAMLILVIIFLGSIFIFLKWEPTLLEKSRALQADIPTSYATKDPSILEEE